MTEKKGRPSKISSLSKITDDDILHRRLIDVAHIAGYKDIAYFSRMFRQYYGTNFRDKKAQLIAQYVAQREKTHTAKEIAAELDTTVERIYQIMRKLKIKPWFRRKSYTPKAVEHFQPPTLRIKLKKVRGCPDSLRVIVKPSNEKVLLVLKDNNITIGSGEAMVPYGPSNLKNEVVKLLMNEHPQHYGIFDPENNSTISYKPELWEIDWGAITNGGNNAKNITKTS